MICLTSVERDGQTAYSVESMGLSVGAHSRPSKILLDSDWSESDPNPNSDANPVDMRFFGEQDGIGFKENKEWIPVKRKRRRSAKALVSSTLQYSDTRALLGRNVFHRNGEVTGEMTTIIERADGGIPERKHLRNQSVCGKQSISESAMTNGPTTNEKSGRCQLLVKSELG